MRPSEYQVAALLGHRQEEAARGQLHRVDAGQRRGHREPQAWAGALQRGRVVRRRVVASGVGQVAQPHQTHDDDRQQRRHADQSVERRASPNLTPPN